ncbi:CLUMA_CG005932, isoform A [Clunio marinus]|uniref:CLUMA_CG005932, isoform A n=1 Tax=Clunio marinus TaxID=568069 RepID=A0A1J1HYE6_9DIPT|nr:CLUMA_CG005932, isoform A [Clunio marinus]
MKVKKFLTSNVCRVTADCPLNAICEPRSGWDGQCVCRDGYFMKPSGKTRHCIQIADYGELCYMDQQCEFRLGLYAECRNGQCACKSNAHYIVNENACFKSSKIGDYCRLTSNCAVDLTTCVKGECRCPLNYHSNWEKNRCLKNVELNETCYNHEECVAENSICYQTCKCRTSHVMSQDGKQCLPLANSLYQKCQEDSQCSQVAYTYCGSNQTCICLSDHHDINSVRISDDSYNDDRQLNVQLSLNFFQRCHVTVRLNEVCEDDLNCVIAHSSCINRRCQCDDGFSEFRGKFCSNADRVQISLFIALVLSFTRLL